MRYGEPLGKFFPISVLVFHRAAEFYEGNNVENSCYADQYEVPKVNVSTGDLKNEESAKQHKNG